MLPFKIIKIPLPLLNKIITTGRGACINQWIFCTADVSLRSQRLAHCNIGRKIWIKIQPCKISKTLFSLLSCPWTFWIEDIERICTTAKIIEVHLPCLLRRLDKSLGIIYLLTIFSDQSVFSGYYSRKRINRIFYTEIVKLSAYANFSASRLSIRKYSAVFDC